MKKARRRRPCFKLDRMKAEQRRVLDQMYADGESYRDIAERLSRMMGYYISHNAVSNFCRERIQKEAERATRLQEQADNIASVLVATDSTEMAAKTRAALQTVFFNALNESSEENLSDLARELRELEKVDVARERVAIEQQKVKISEKQLALKNKELEARLAAARAAVQQIEEAAANGNAALPANLLSKLKEAYGIA